MTYEPIRLRRLAVILLGLLVTGALLALAVQALAPGGWTVWEAVILLCLAGTIPWSALSAANSLVGFAILMGARDPVAAVLPALRHVRPGPPRGGTALAVCIRNEDMAVVLPPLARLLDGLEAAGAGDRFALWLLSDTQDAAHAVAKEVEALGRRAALVRADVSSVPDGQRLVAEGDTPEHVDQVLSKPPRLRDLREALARCCTV